jgi:hypothetical protein
MRKSIVDRIKEVIADLKQIENEGREMTKAEKAKVKRILLSIAEQRIKELGWDK